MSKLPLCALLLLIGSICVANRADKWTPPEHQATIATPLNAKWWQDIHHGQINAEVAAANGDVDLLFVGDSITHWFKKMKWMKDPDCGEAVWGEYYAPRKAVNTGIMADKTQHVLWRLQNGNLDGLKPKVAVVMIGTNNTGSQETAQQTADGVLAIINYLHVKSPKTKVLLLGIFPRGKKLDDKKRAQNDEVNKILATFEESLDYVTYLDISKEFLKEDGNVNLELMPDGLHPNAAGYKVWAEAMEPSLEQLLGE